LQKRILVLPIAWGVFGIGLVYALQILFGNIVNIAPTPANDKPIGGSVLPALFFTSAAILGIIAITLIGVGFWTFDLSTKRNRADLVALAVLLGSGFLFWYTPLTFFPAIVALVYFMAAGID
jgi:hypothetical protein